MLMLQEPNKHMKGLQTVDFSCFCSVVFLSAEVFSVLTEQPQQRCSLHPDTGVYHIYTLMCLCSHLVKPSSFLCDCDRQHCGFLCTEY